MPVQQDRPFPAIGFCGVMRPTKANVAQVPVQHHYQLMEEIMSKLTDLSQTHPWLFVLVVFLGLVTVTSLTNWYLVHSQYYAWPV